MSDDQVERVKAAIDEAGESACRDYPPSHDEMLGKLARAAIAAMHEPWRPIETAPKDGTRILAYETTDADDTQPQIVLWLDAPDKPGWYISFDHTPCLGKIWKPPTHWMPLPAPPATS